MNQIMHELRVKKKNKNEEVIICCRLNRGYYEGERMQ